MKDNMLQFRCSSDFIYDIDEICLYYGISRSSFLTIVITKALKDFNFFESDEFSNKILEDFKNEK